MSVADMLAAARGEGSGGGAAAPAAAPAVEDPKETARGALEAGRKPKAGAADQAEDTVAEDTVAEEEAPAEELAEAESSGEGGGRRDDITSVDEQIEYCRKIDAG